MTKPGLPGPHEPTSGRSAALISLWRVRIPMAIGAWAPQTANAFADGSWTARRAPGLTAYAPIVAAALGFLAPFLWPGMRTVYSESLVFMALVVTGAILSGPVGVMLLLGYVVGDLLRGARDASLGRIGGQLISYMLLAVPAIRIPVLARRFIERDRLPENRAWGLALATSLFALACGVLVFLWSQALIVLIRPVFTWTGRSPEVSAIAPVQTRWEWLVLLAMAVAIVRSLLEEVQGAKSTGEKAGINVQPQGPTEAAGWTGLTPQVAMVVRAVLWTIGITLILAGTYESWIDAVAVAAVSGMLGAFRARPGAKFLRTWSLMVSEVPPQVRLVAGSLIGFFCSLALLQAFWTTGSLRPLTAGALTTMFLFGMLFPPQVEMPSSEESP